MEELEEELRWAKEVRAAIEHGGKSNPHAKAMLDRVPERFANLKIDEFEVDSLEEHIQRLERDLRDAQEIEYEEPDHIIGGDH